MKTKFLVDGTSALKDFELVNPDLKFYEDNIKTLQIKKIKKSPTTPYEMISSHKGYPLSTNRKDMLKLAFGAIISVSLFFVAMVLL